jgi:hypothetical protein
MTLCLGDHQEVVPQSTRSRRKRFPTGRAIPCQDDLPFVDLGMSPYCESYLSEEQVWQGETFCPLKVRASAECLLIQLPTYIPPEDIFSEHAYFCRAPGLWGHATPISARRTRCRRARDDVDSSERADGGHGQPIQEKWLADHLEATGARIGIGVGASSTSPRPGWRRRPAWMTRLGVEWLFELTISRRRGVRRAASTASSWVPISHWSRPADARARPQSAQPV